MRVNRHRLSRADPGFQHSHVVVLEKEVVELGCGDQRVERIGVLPELRVSRSHDDSNLSEPRFCRLPPDFLRYLDDEAQLRPLLILGESIPLQRGGEAALR
jgi:hypothetical protein